jgi:hypothetical protein
LGGEGPIDGGVSTDTTTPPVVGDDGAVVAICAPYPGAEAFTPSGSPRPHCYWSHAETTDWSSAVSTCTNEGGHLVTILSMAENTFVINVIADFTAAERVWLGATDDKVSTDRTGGGPYHWITAEPFTYHPWAPQNPDGTCTACPTGHEVCCQHRVCASSDGDWWDRYEGEAYSFVCEAEP